MFAWIGRFLTQSQPKTLVYKYIIKCLSESVTKYQAELREKDAEIARLRTQLDRIN